MHDFEQPVADHLSSMYGQHTDAVNIPEMVSLPNDVIGIILIHQNRIDNDFISE